MKRDKSELEEIIKNKIVLRINSEHEKGQHLSTLSKRYTLLLSSIYVKITGEFSFTLWVDSIKAIETIKFNFHEFAAQKPEASLISRLSVNSTHKDDTYHLLQSERKIESSQVTFKVSSKNVQNFEVSNCPIDLVSSIEIHIDYDHILFLANISKSFNEKEHISFKQNEFINKNKGIITQQQEQIKEIKSETARLRNEHSAAEQEFNEMIKKYKKLRRSIKDYPDTLVGYRTHNFILIILYAVIAAVSISALAYVSDYFISILKPSEIPQNFGVLDAIAFALYKSPATAIALGILAFSAKMIISIYREIVVLNKESLTMTQLNVLAQTSYNSASNAFEPDSEEHAKAVEAKLSLITKVFTKELTSNVKDKSKKEDE